MCARQQASDADCFFMYRKLLLAPVVSSICLSDWAPASKWTVWRLMSPLGKITTHFVPERGEWRTHGQEHSERMKCNIILLLLCTSCYIFSFILSAVCFCGWYSPLQRSSNHFHTWKQTYSVHLNPRVPQTSCRHSQVFCVTGVSVGRESSVTSSSYTERRSDIWMWEMWPFPRIQNNCFTGLDLLMSVQWTCRRLMKCDFRSKLHFDLIELMFVILVHVVILLTYCSNVATCRADSQSQNTTILWWFFTITTGLSAFLSGFFN